MPLRSLPSRFEAKLVQACNGPCEHASMPTYAHVRAYAEYLYVFLACAWHMPVHARVRREGLDIKCRTGMPHANSLTYKYWT